MVISKGCSQGLCEHGSNLAAGPDDENFILLHGIGRTSAANVGRDGVLSKAFVHFNGVVRQVV